MHTHTHALCLVLGVLGPGLASGTCGRLLLLWASTPASLPPKETQPGKLSLQVDRIAQVGIPSNFESLPQHPCHLRSAEGTLSSSGAEVRGRIFRRQGQHRSGLAAYLTDRVVPERARRRLLQSIRSPEPSHVSNGSPWPASKSQPTVRTASDTRSRAVGPCDTYNVRARRLKGQGSQLIITSGAPFGNARSVIPAHPSALRHKMDEEDGLPDGNCH